MKRVLFVDDELSVLAVLERMLRPYRDRWSMKFVAGPVEALTHLQTAPVDVIVTDMRMPGMDGAALLDIVRDRYPGVVRIVLSGEPPAEVAPRVTFLAHLLLSKPCEADAIIGALDRMCA